MLKIFTKNIFILIIGLGVLLTGSLFVQGAHAPLVVASYLKSMAALHDDLGVVVGTKIIKFNETISNAYNASIMEQGDGYLLSFRHDSSKKICGTCKYRKPQIMMTYLDKNFDQLTPIKTLSSKALVPEDARLHSLNDQLFLTYNDEPGRHAHNNKRQLFIGKLDVGSWSLSDIKQLPSGGIELKKVEKNWVPFEYPEHTGSLYYIYLVSPYTIIKIGSSDELSSAGQSYSIAQDLDDVWKKDIWGEIRGGTPARFVDGAYITFFHAWNYYPKYKSYFYVVGAYVFEARPPFKILGITPKPIFFKEMYSAQHLNVNKHVIYPAGFAIKRDGNKTLLHVSCGENDTAIRVVSIDKDALFSSMVIVP